MSISMSVNDEYDYFAKADLSEFRGEWVAICNRKVVSHSKELKIVVKEAEAVCEGKMPLYAIVPSGAIMLL